MRNASPKPCRNSACGALVYDGSGWCERHMQPAWAKSPNAPQRITGRRLQEERRRLFRDEPLCRKCSSMNRITLATERDHITPLSEGGQDVRENVQPLCAECHLEKTMQEALRGRARSGQAIKEHQGGAKPGGSGWGGSKV